MTANEARDPLPGRARPRIAFPDLDERIRIRETNDSAPGRRAWLALVDASGIRTVLGFLEKRVADPEAFAFLLPSGELVVARLEGEFSVRLDDWRAAPFRVVEVGGTA